MLSLLLPKVARNIGCGNFQFFLFGVDCLLLVILIAVVLSSKDEKTNKHIKWLFSNDLVKNMTTFYLVVQLAMIGIVFSNNYNSIFIPCVAGF